MRIGFIGDTHGDKDGLRQAVRCLMFEKVDIITQVGDFGFMWPGNDQIQWVNEMLDAECPEIHFLVIDGNHDDHARWHGSHSLMASMSGKTNPTRLFKSQSPIALLRGSVANLRPRNDDAHVTITMGALGGAHSTDKHLRVENESWWQDEAFTQKDLYRLLDNASYTSPLSPVSPIHHHLDILVTHECPNIPWVGKFRRPTLDTRWTRSMISEAISVTTPKLVVHGHYHERHVSKLNGHTTVVGLGESRQDLCEYVMVYDTESDLIRFPDLKKPL